ncbi:glycosyltransferase family 2 protein [Schinkia azotoformans]|uniref:glycosyltransferase family 2 protein n=1 Tax=Schinkia azotoformans TaxID=1454 RepID=UPI002DBFA49F|nr:glycosyltransferase family A protein [Schinkia azotoformans]MEC1760395.1 glycosyltransferase family A protein [Schinkia azotoformans]
MSDSEIKISVIIPVYNAKKYLGKCLDSVLAQSYSNWEAFIIDDASTDDSYKILSQFAEKDERFNIYRHNVNKGPGHTRNEAIQYATENKGDLLQNYKEYIVFLDSDDWIEKSYFQSIVQIANNEKADVIFVDVVQEDEFGNFIKNECMSLYKEKDKDTIIRHQMTGKLPWGGWRKAVKGDLITKNKINYSSDAIGEEAIYSFKLLYNAKSIAFIEDALYHYVIHSNSQSGKRDDDPWGPASRKMEEYLKEINVYNKYKKTHNSFAFTSLIVSIYRITQYYSLKEAIRKSRLSFRRYQRDYGFDIEKDSLEKRISFLLPFARFNTVLPIVLIAKLKAIINSI